MADRNVTVRLRAETSDFKREMADVAKSTEQVGKSAQSAASTARKEWTQWWPEVQKGDGIMKQLGKSFRENRAEWDKLAGGMLKAGGAMTAVTAGVLATGVAYNTLQQTSRAALTTMMGGAEAANAQMDKLDAFARNSPFAKTTFINAQRQLIGFGMEAEKVIPTLDAIQNAVAAMGGSNQDIAELSFIIAQVGAAGKITATDLMQFGQRGVDAATIIGSQMGKTGAQIRDEITAGTLDADEAIDALVAGMQEKFGGAAAGVKDTFSGAVDRVKAAIRDLSSEFATFLVNPQGGGALIDWTNKFADLLRAVQKLPDPVKKTGGAVFAFSGVALLAAGSAIKLAGALMDMRETARKLSTDMPRVADGLGRLGKAAGIAAAVLAANEAFKMLEEQLGKMYATASSQEEILSLILNEDDLSRFGASVTEADSWLNRLSGALARINLMNPAGMVGQGLFFGATKDVEMFDAALAELVTSGRADLAAEALERAGISAEQAASQLPAYQEALKRVNNQSKLTADSTDRLAEVEQAAADAAQSAADAQDKFADAVLKAASAALEAANSEIAYEAALDRATKSIKDNGKTLDVNTEKGRANKSALLDIAAAAVRVAEDQLKAGKSTDEVGRSMDDARKKFIDTAIKMGATRAEAESMADQFGLTRGQVVALDRSLDDLPDVVRLRVEAATAQARADIANLQAAINNLKGKTVVIATSFSGPGAQYVRPGMVGVNASGGVWDKAGALGMVRAFRSGGFFDGKIGAQQPQIRPYSSPRGLLWSEEGSGPWEAFISGHPAKRDRSLRIWLDVGRRLGAIAAHAEGGLQEYRNAAVRAPSPVMPAAQPGAMEIAGTLDLGDGITAALRGVADFTQMGGLRSRMAAGVRS